MHVNMHEYIHIMYRWYSYSYVSKYTIVWPVLVYCASIMCLCRNKIYSNTCMYIFMLFLYHYIFPLVMM